MNSLFLDGLVGLVERVLLPQVAELQPGVGPAHQEDEVRDEEEFKERVHEELRVQREGSSS